MVLGITKWGPSSNPVTPGNQKCRRKADLLVSVGAYQYQFFVIRPPEKKKTVACIETLFFDFYGGF